MRFMVMVARGSQARFIVMPHGFRESGFCIIGGTDPLVRAGHPRPALAARNQVLATINEAAGGPAAGEGVRPTARF
jgi:hypothetical protein